MVLELQALTHTQSLHSFLKEISLYSLIPIVTHKSLIRTPNPHLSSLFSGAHSHTLSTLLIPTLLITLIFTIPLPVHTSSCLSTTGASMELGYTFWQGVFEKNTKTCLNRAIFKPSIEVITPRSRD